MSILDHTPKFTTDEASQLARELFGLDGQADRLPSDRDQNFSLTTATGERAVLKIANGLEERTLLEAQQRALVHLAASSELFPRVHSTLDGRTLAEVIARDGKRHYAWLISLRPGRPLGELPHHSDALLEDLGRQAGELDRRLADFDDPAIHRQLVWDLANGLETVDRYRELIDDPPVRRWVDGVVVRFQSDVSPLLPGLRRSAIHNDLNDYNLLVETSGDVGERHQRLSGIVDFGDLVWSWTVGDLAILLAYAMLGKEDPLAVAGRIVGGYHRVWPLEEAEVAALFGLTCLRLATSICMAAEQHRRRPDDHYLVISQEPIRRLLPRLEQVSWGLATATFRAACGWPAAATEPIFLKWLEGRGGADARVIDLDWEADPWITLDLGVASPLIEGDPARNTEPLLTARLAGLMNESGARLAVGQYDEARMLYTSPLFGQNGRVTEERRTVHLGIDLFTAKGTAVHAPLAGRVVVATNNRAHLDYGPMIILEHQIAAGVSFQTLYGHLSEESLDGLVVGREILAGEQIGSIGSSEINGGWTPHLHFQIILDDLGLGADSRSLSGH
jgi:Ser/Thr protein kinase RdoA (MazF antagonist)